TGDIHWFPFPREVVHRDQGCTVELDDANTSVTALAWHKSVDAEHTRARHSLGHPFHHLHLLGGDLSGGFDRVAAEVEVERVSEENTPACVGDAGGAHLLPRQDGQLGIAELQGLVHRTTVMVLRSDKVLHCRATVPEHAGWTSVDDSDKPSAHGQEPVLPARLVLLDQDRSVLFRHAPERSDKSRPGPEPDVDAGTSFGIARLHHSGAQRLHPPPGTNFLPWREHSVLQTGQSTVPQQSAGDVLVADDLLDQAVVEGVSPVSP